VEYLKTPPTVDELDTLLGMLGMEPRELMRKREAEYKELGLDDESLNRDQLIAAMAEHPKLIERPIAVSGDRAVMGRPTERVLELV
jgi:arsenate reductase